MVTIYDIAEKAGVSVMTVSNVINNNSKKVSKKTIERINEIIKEVGYVPNLTARSLSARNSKIIALCISNKLFTSDDILSTYESPYNSELIGTLQYYIEEQGYYLMLCGGETLDEVIGNLKTWQVAGAIFLGGFDPFIPKIKETLSIPMTFLDSYYEQDIMNVGIDDFHGGYLATKYLINHGHSHIGFVSNLKEPNIVLEKRFNGYLKAMDENGFSSTYRHIIHGDISYNGGILAGKEISASETITAVFATADILAIGIMEGARLSGKSLPKDLSIIGFDDIPSAKFVTPKLTTINQDLKEKAKLVVHSIFKLIEGPDEKEKYTRIYLPVTLVERNSVIDI